MLFSPIIYLLNANSQVNGLEIIKICTKKTQNFIKNKNPLTTKKKSGKSKQIMYNIIYKVD